MTELRSPRTLPLAKRSWGSKDRLLAHINPLSPHLRSPQPRTQQPHLKSKFLAASPAKPTKPLTRNCSGASGTSQPSAKANGNTTKPATENTSSTSAAQNTKPSTASRSIPNSRLNSRPRFSHGLKASLIPDYPRRNSTDKSASSSTTTCRSDFQSSSYDLLPHLEFE
jgi:hypothetical protein